MIDIELGDEVYFKNGEVSRVIEIDKMYLERGFYLSFMNPVHGFLEDDNRSTYWGYNPDGKVIRQNSTTEGNDIINVVHKGIDDFFHLYKGDVIITSNGSEAKIAEDVVLIKKHTGVHLVDSINVNESSCRARKQKYIDVVRDSLQITSARGPDTRIIKVIRGDRNEKKDV